MMCLSGACPSTSSTTWYRAALDYLYEEDWRPLNTGLVLHLHRLLFSFIDVPGGGFKTSENIVVDRLPDGTQVKRFTPEEFQRVTDAARIAGSKKERVQLYVRDHAPASFRMADIRASLPGVSDATIRNALDALRAAGVVEVDGPGRNATWNRIGSR